MPKNNPSKNYAGKTVGSSRGQHIPGEKIGQGLVDFFDSEKRFHGEVSEKRFLEKNGNVTSYTPNKIPKK
jgi:hypothetical protein